MPHTFACKTKNILVCRRREIDGTLSLSTRGRAHAVHSLHYVEEDAAGCDNDHLCRFDFEVLIDATLNGHVHEHAGDEPNGQHAEQCSEHL